MLRTRYKQGNIFLPDLPFPVDTKLGVTEGALYRNYHSTHTFHWPRSVVQRLAAGLLGLRILCQVVKLIACVHCSRNFYIIKTAFCYIHKDICTTPPPITQVFSKEETQLWYQLR